MKHPTIISAAILSATIIVYGFIQMWVANGQRYEFHAIKFNSDNERSVTEILDKRTGRVIRLLSFNNVIIWDYSHSTVERLKWRNKED